MNGMAWLERVFDIDLSQCPNRAALRDVRSVPRLGIAAGTAYLCSFCASNSFHRTCARDR